MIKTEASEKEELTLSTEHIKNFEKLFCEVMENTPTIICNFKPMAKTVELVRLMVIQECGTSVIKPVLDSQLMRASYNVAVFDSCLNALSEEYTSVKALAEDKSTPSFAARLGIFIYQVLPL
ncbi:hypothetical protein [Legionella sp.]|uniref:hypothetical protein n=1 Tax=Legionella sp. TaxID=459 RepID=UPI003D0B2399